MQRLRPTIESQRHSTKTTRSARHALLLLALLPALACAKSTLASKFIKSAKISASAGGTLTVTAADSADYAGTSITIPPGALAADTTISIAPAVCSESGCAGLSAGVSLGPIVEFGPLGTQFSAPVTLRVPFSAAQLAASRNSDVFVYFTASPSAPSGSNVSGQLTVDTSAGTVSFTASTLGDFSSWLPDTCLEACPADCAATGALCYSDGKQYCNDCIAACSGATVAACPSCQSDSDCSSGQSCVTSCSATGQADGGAADGSCTSNCTLNVDACVQACGVGCAAPGASCYSDGNTYCGDCQAACYGAVPVSCNGTTCQSDTDCSSGQICLSSCSTLGGSDADAGCAGTCVSSDADAGVCTITCAGSSDDDGGALDGGCSTICIVDGGSAPGSGADAG